MPRSKTLTPSVPVPQDDAEAREAIRELGERQRELTRLETLMNDAIAGLKSQHGAEAEPIAARIAALHDGLRTYAEANRLRLTGGGKRKHFRFSTGTVSWRHRPARVTVRGVEAVLGALREAGLDRFVRTKEEIDREAMLRERDVAMNVPGVTIGSDGEDFVVEPDEDLLEEAR